MKEAKPIDVKIVATMFLEMFQAVAGLPINEAVKQTMLDLSGELIEMPTRAQVQQFYDDQAIEASLRRDNSPQNARRLKDFYAVDKSDERRLATHGVKFPAVFIPRSQC